MSTRFRYGKEHLRLNIPESAVSYISHLEDPAGSVTGMLEEAVRKPAGSIELYKMLKQRGKGSVVIVVSDITRPIPYYQFLPYLLGRIEQHGVARDEILILIATGMHRPSTRAEQTEMFGDYIASHYRIIDHEADNPGMIAAVERKDKSGSVVMMNRHYLEAGFRIVTGLVEPHFMAGFSGGRKAICPGLASLPAIRNFHGAEILGHPLARNGQIEGNPCHDESLSIASLIPPDFTINIILDQEKRINSITGGDLTLSHRKAIEIVKKSSCPTVSAEADIVITSCGGYPLDATFYQCVKAFVSCLPAVRKNGIIVAFGGCSEGIGSMEYTQTMFSYSGRYKDFLEDIKRHGNFVKDQWQFQMHSRVLEKVGEENLMFMTSGLNPDDLKKLSINPIHNSSDKAEEAIQEIIDRAVAEGKTIACIPEGPYCAPL